MLRGFRWQLFAFLAALVLLGGVWLTRPSPVEEVVYVPQPGQMITAPSTDPIPTDESQPAIVQPLTTPITSPLDPTIYREGLIGSMQRLNPLYASLNPVDSDITALIFEGLTEINEYGEAIPNLAERWIVSQDALEYVVNLRRDVLWQDGLPFTAADVVFTMALLRSPEFTGEEALGAFWRTVEAEAIDDYTVRFRLTQPLGSFPEALRIGILPVHVLDGTSALHLATHPFNLAPIGTGPYQLEALRVDPNGRVIRVDLQASPVYRQRPDAQNRLAILRVQFSLFDQFDQALEALNQQTIDGLAARNFDERRALLTLSTQNRSITIRNGIEPAVGMLIYNWGDENFRVFREPRVRLALQAGLNRETLIERNLPNLAIRADSPMLLNSWAYAENLPWLPYDLAQARNLLENARINITTQVDSEDVTPEVTPTGANTGLFSFSILTPDDPALIAIAQEMAAQWAQLNIGVTVDAVNAETYLARLTTHDFQAAIVELSKGGSADPDVYEFWHQGQFPDGKNYGGADDREISEILERARRDPNSLNRTQNYHLFQRQFAQRALAMPLYYPLYTYAVNGRVQNVQLGFIGAPRDRFLTIPAWTLSE
ncbi:MAG: ABC transporter substrate-binding protein [Anaerolineae bacterium]|jgi:peptide/nickel transport system substrate-binding protein|nr:ABC transporter substrate-binding protein [Anaerolineae bacterium]